MSLSAFVVIDLTRRRPDSPFATPCPVCAASLQLIASTLDVKTGKTIRLFHCTQYGENWAD